MEKLEYIKLAFMIFGMFSFSVVAISYLYFKLENVVLRIAKRKTYKKISFALWLGCKLASKPRPQKRISTTSNTAKTVKLGRSKAI